MNTPLLFIIQNEPGNTNITQILKIMQDLYVVIIQGQWSLSMSYEEFKTCVSRNYVLLAHVSTISLGLNGCGKRVGQTVKQEAKTQTQEQTVAALLKKADAQDAKAQFNLGKMYNNCDGVTMSAWANSISSHGNSDKISHSDAGEISQS